MRQFVFNPGSTGRLEAIWIKRGKLAPMDPVERARIVAGKGLVGNANQGGKRQITLLGADAWATAVKELGAELDPSTRRANLLVSGVQMVECRGRTLQIGDLRIRIYGETRPCELMDRQQPGLQSVLSEDWRGGVFGEALDTSSIGVGDSVRWLD